MNEITRVVAAPSAPDLIARARALVPVLAARAAEAEQSGRVSEQSIRDLTEAGLFLAMQPRGWGGYELGLDVVNDIQMTLAEGCMSTAWVYAVLVVEPFLIALMDPQAAEDVWHDDIHTLMSGSSAGAAGNTLVRVDGGFRISGRWRFASGCGHAQWTFLGGCPVVEADGTVTVYRVLLPREDYEILDTWRVTGLKATGSNDIVVKDRFIPAHRAIRQVDLFNCTCPGHAVNTAPIYHVPFGQVFAMSVMTPAIGGLRGMLDAFTAYGSRRVARGIGPTALDPVAQLLCAEIATTLEEIEARLRQHARDLMGYAERHELPPMERRMAFRFQGSFAVERASNLAVRLFKAAGASGLYTDGSPLGRFVADISAARQHLINQYEAHGRSWGRILLGGDLKDNQDFFL
jgi:3-hydroxy-9,10-secoandrosta-1,3,5(10)-triene-9,17-dione monooxygenase